MAWVYILSSASRRFYIGLTDDLSRRISEHQRGQCHTTRRLGGNIGLVVAKEMSTISEARKLEVVLKKKKNPRLAISILNQKEE